MSARAEYFMARPLGVPTICRNGGAVGDDVAMWNGRRWDPVTGSTLAERRVVRANQHADGSDVVRRLEQEANRCAPARRWYLGACPGKST